MKKGFTLIELLIVMVVVGILVTVALPKYKASMEKGRGLEGVANAAAVSDAVNAYFVKNGNSYGDDVTVLRTFALGGTSASGAGGVAGVTQSKYFNPPQINGTGPVTVSVQRAGNLYTVVFTSNDGEVTGRSCTGNARYCKALGL